MAGKASWSIAAVVVACLAGHVRGAVVIDDPEALNEISPECLTVGSNLLTFCAAEVNAAQEFFGVEIGNAEAFQNVTITEKNTREFVKELGQPTNECCMGTCEFNNKFCGCIKAMEDVIAGLVGGEFKFFRTVSDSVGKKCGIPTYYQEACPVEAEREQAEKGDCTKFS